MNEAELRIASWSPQKRAVARQWAKQEAFKIGSADKNGNLFLARGANLKLLKGNSPQVILAGVADSGKTFISCVKMHQICLEYPGAQCSLMRKTFASMAGTVLQRYTKIVEGHNVQILGANKPERYIYPNGSMVWIGGLDDPNRVLSAERDAIYVNQAEELTIDDWEMLSTRCTGRGAIVPHAQLFGDCNPGGSKHWIRTKAANGELELLVASHHDNPTIYNEDGSLTESGQRRLDALAKLTGVRRKRLFEGIWATAEGAVYDMFDASVHMKYRPASEFKRWFLTLDEGFTNPAVILLVGEDSDGRWHVAREFYQTGQLQETVVRQTVQWSNEMTCEMVCVDNAAAGLIADLQAVHLYTRGGKGRVLDGIQHIQNRLSKAGDGLPRLTFDPSCVNCQNEFESYVWRPEKDVPVKEHDHTSDALRYLADVLGEPDAGVGSASEIRTGRRRVFEGAE